MTGGHTLTVSEVKKPSLNPPEVRIKKLARLYLPPSGWLRINL
jgi:hypothetical protein